MRIEKDLGCDIDDFVMSLDRRSLFLQIKEYLSKIKNHKSSWNASIDYNFPINFDEDSQL